MACENGEWHIVRRPGMAVVARWERIPAPFKDRLVAQAVLAHDRDAKVRTRERLLAVSREHLCEAE
jgi:hypothetical protein